MTYFKLRVAMLVPALAVVLCNGVADASAIFGTLSNFDIYNTTPEPAEGAEIELEGCDSSSIGGHFPSHFNVTSIIDYNENGKSGTRIRFEGYNFNLPVTMGSLQPNSNPASTNGHQLTNSAGGEHFGFWLSGAQPTATRFYWLNDIGGTYERIGSLPAIVPGPTWTYVPPANPGEAAVVQAVVKVPEPAEVVVQKPNSTWMKVFKVKLPASYLPHDPGEMQDLLLRLVSDANPENEQADVPLNDIVPEGENPIEVESEWELLEGGGAPKEKMNEDVIDEENDKVIIRRYEFYEYTGLYDDEHEPTTDFLDPGDLLEPPNGELGKFLSANMVAAVLDAFVPGDANFDGRVDGIDYLVWAANYGDDPAADPPGSPGNGDFNDDGIVDGLDYLTWAGNYGQGPNDGVAVPEPSSFALLLVGCLSTLLRRRR